MIARKYVTEFMKTRAKVDSETGSRGQRRVRGKPPLRDEEEAARQKVKFVVYGVEILEKKVKHSGNSGRIYLPAEWIGKQIKVVRTD